MYYTIRISNKVNTSVIYHKKLQLRLTLHNWERLYMRAVRLLNQNYSEMLKVNKIFYLINPE